MQDPRHEEDNHLRDLTGPAALRKLRDLATGVCMFTTVTGQRLDPSRPMALQGVDEQGALYFFSAASSDKNKELAADPAVQLYFAKDSASEYLSIYGHATIARDRNKIDEYWNPLVKTWFQGGPDDPDLTVVRVQPATIHYWDTKHNQMVALLKVAASLVTGKTMDDGVEGKLSV